MSYKNRNLLGASCVFLQAVIRGRILDCAIEMETRSDQVAFGVRMDA